LAGEPGAGGEPASPDPPSFGGAPTHEDECASDLEQVVPLSAPDCPAEPGSDNQQCDVPENTLCVWQVGAVDDVQQGGFIVSGCYASLTGTTRWRGYGYGGAVGPAGVNWDHCPSSVPAAGSSCSGHAGEYCYYPQADCGCADDQATWACTEPTPERSNMPVEVRRLCVPEGLDESKRVFELSDAEVTTWCQWHGDPSGAPRPEVRPELDETSWYATKTINMNVIACMPELPVSLCERNFRALPACTATLGDVNDCVETIRAMRGDPFSGWVGHGCAPLLTSPGCEGLVVSLDCNLPLAD
jgi:hypothetical protein